MEGYVLLVFILAALGLGILIIEMFVPTAGMLGILSGTCFIGAFYCAYRAWYQTGQMGWWWGFVVGVVIVVPGVIWGGLSWIPRTAFGRELFMAPQPLAELTPFKNEEAQLRRLIHQRGKTTTMFAPGGMVQVGSQRLHAESEGIVIEPDTDIEVVGIKGNRLVVRPVAAYDEPVSTQTTETMPSPVDVTTPANLNANADRNVATSVGASTSIDASASSAKSTIDKSIDFEFDDDV